MPHSADELVGRSSNLEMVRIMSAPILCAQGTLRTGPLRPSDAFHPVTMAPDTDALPNANDCVLQGWFYVQIVGDRCVRVRMHVLVL